MKKLFFTLFLMAPGLLSAKNEKKDFLKHREPEEITSPLSSTETLKQNPLCRLLDNLSFSAGQTEVLTIPILETSKDLGANYGVMPIIAVKDETRIKSVIAPSFNNNKYMGKTFSYRHYIFPDENSILMGRASVSDKAQKEFIVWYFNPDLLGRKIRLNVQILNSADPKYSFYGYGPDSSKNEKANYTFYTKGVETSFTMPLFKSLYFDYTPSFYSYKIRDGIVDSDERFSTIYKTDYAADSPERNFLVNKFSVLFDTTDHPFLPKIGNFFIFSAAFSRKSLAGDYDYSVYSFESKKYYNYGNGKKYVTAVRYLLQWQTGEEIPFYAMSRLGESSGLRMAGDGRFTGRGKFTATIEERITVSKSPLLKFVSEFEISPFLDLGTVFDKPSKMSTGELKYGPGISFRLLLRPQVVATLNFASGSEGFNSIIKVGYPF